jgi:hypothetical protein
MRFILKYLLKEYSYLSKILFNQIINSKNNKNIKTQQKIIT